jgi:hypothetical protein
MSLELVLIFLYRMCEPYSVHAPSIGGGSNSNLKNEISSLDYGRIRGTTTFLPSAFRFDNVDRFGNYGTINYYGIC